MPKRAAKTLPAEVQHELDKARRTIERVLWKLSDGALDHEAIPELEGVLNPPLAAARRAGAEARTSVSTVMGRDVNFQMVIATHVRARRRKAELTQDELAQEMRKRGFDWKRITVAEIEAGADKPEGGRKVSYEELYALGEIFEAPMALLLLPEKGDFVAIGDLGTAKIVDSNSARVGVIGQATIGGKQ